MLAAGSDITRSKTGPGNFCGKSRGKSELKKSNQRFLKADPKKKTVPASHLRKKQRNLSGTAYPCFIFIYLHHYRQLDQNRGHIQKG
jgi:gluconate kinase